MPAYYLTLNGTVIPCRAGGLLTPSQYGEAERMYNNVLRSTIEPTLRTRRWQFTTGPLLGAEWDAIAPILRSTAVLTAAGYAITRGSVGIGVLCLLGTVENEANSDGDVAYTATFTLYERSTASAGVGGPTTGLWLSNIVEPTYDDGAGGVYNLARTLGPNPFGEGYSGTDQTYSVTPCGSGSPCSVAQCAAQVDVVGKWVTLPFTAPTILNGPGYFTALARGINPWGTWWRQRLTIQVTLIRAAGGSAGPFAFTSSAVDFSGGNINLTTVSPLVALAVAVGDRLMFEGLAIVGMNGCRSDDGFRPSFLMGQSFASAIMPGVLVAAA